MTEAKNVHLRDRLCEATLKPVIDSWQIAQREPEDCDLPGWIASTRLEGIESYKRRLRSTDEVDEPGPQDPGDPRVDFRGEKRGNKIRRLLSDPDCRFASKGSSGMGAYPDYAANASMEDRNRILLGVGVEIFRSSTSEEQGALDLLDRAKRRLRYRPKRLGADKGFSHEGFNEGVFEHKIEPYIATDTRSSSRLHMRARVRRRGMPYGCRNGVGRRSRDCLEMARSLVVYDAPDHVSRIEYGKRLG